MKNEMNALSTSSKWPRWIHEYLFLLNLAWAIVWIERECVVSKYGVGGHAVASYFHRIFRYPIALLGHPGFLEQTVWPLIVATVAFAFLRVLSRFAATDVALRTIAGAAAIGGGPLALWITDGFFLQRNYRIESLYIAISLDVIFVSICAILYYLRRPPLSAPLMVVVLLVHFTICVWMTKGYTDILSCFSAYHQRFHSWGRTFATCSIWIAFRTGFPVVGFLSAVLWVFYVRRMPDHFRPSSFPTPTVN
jgi:hypothetical protein